MEKGFFGSLFDISFSSLVATKVIKVLYVLSIILIGLGTLFFAFSGFTDSVGAGIITLIFAPLIGLLYLIWARVALEVIICLFRIMESNLELVALQRASAGPTAPPPPEPPASTTPPPA